jgi:hypothetical protein
MAEEAKTVLPLAAVEAMAKDALMQEFLWSFFPQEWALSVVNMRTEKLTPDWVVAAANCKNEEDALAMAVHTYLMDWKPEATK